MILAEKLPETSERKSGKATAQMTEPTAITSENVRPGIRLFWSAGYMDQGHAHDENAKLAPTLRLSVLSQYGRIT